MKSILLFGPNGQVGWELQRTLSTLGQVVCVPSTRVNLTQADAIRDSIQATQPDIIVNAAAYTAVDKAESEPDIAQAVNAHAPEIMAIEAKKTNALLVHYSTDYVYRGNATSPYREQHATHPMNVYGRTKLAGDQAIQAVGGRHLIFRTSWVYGARGQNFLRTMQRLMQERATLSIVQDQLGAPTWSRTIAQVTGQVLAQHVNAHAPDGVFHLTCSGQASWYAFATMIRDLSGLNCELVPITSDQYPTPAARPVYSVLCGEKLQNTFGLQCPDWRQALTLCCDAG